MAVQFVLLIRTMYISITWTIDGYTFFIICSYIRTSIASNHFRYGKPRNLGSS